MVYNVENLFDDVHDGTEFREFDPRTASWSTDLFNSRIATIAEVVKKAVPGGPDVIVLQEVENANALRALADTGLAGMGYVRTVLVPKKGLAANIGIISRLPAARVHSYEVPSWKGGVLRDVAEVELMADGATLHVLNNHWKSKTEGARATEQSRLEAAAVVGERVRQILARDSLADIIVAGDMNESADEFSRARGAYQTALIPVDADVPDGYARASIFLASRPEEAGIHGDRLVLFEPWLEPGRTAPGSYIYGGKWETIDHALLSPGLFDGAGFAYERGSFRVFDAAFLLSENGAPKKWEGPRGQRGYSDHLPLLITLHVRE
jgi:endonuclease/exonuclease/phosphatase family metal-dependent hydrolase